MAKADPIRRKKEVPACPGDLVQMKLSDTAHKQKGFTAISAQHLFKRVPVRVRPAIPRAHARTISHANVPSDTHSGCSSAFFGEENDDNDGEDSGVVFRELPGSSR